MWLSRTKHDLIIEVWEKLDCESVGAVEIEAIEAAVSAQFGDSAVESPMRIARLLADEGAALRHSEIMELWVTRYSDRPHDAEFRNLIKLDDLDSAERSLKRVENLRRKFAETSDNEGIRLLREEVLDAKTSITPVGRDRKTNTERRMQAAEIAEWLTIWLQSPDIFESWIKLRKNSVEFKSKFGSVNKKN
jgi:hypothetical protein